MPWLNRQRNQSADVGAARVICFHHLGGDASVFSGWSEALGVEVWTAELPGRGGRAGEQLEGSFTRAMDAIWREAHALLDRPYLLYGHCMGSRFAYELTRRACAEDLRRPTRLFVSSLYPPRDQQMAVDVTTALRKSYRETGQIPPVVQLPRAVREDPVRVREVLAVFDADIDILGSFDAPGDARLPVDLTVFGGSEDFVVTEDSLRRWESHAGAGFDLHMLPGGHMFLQKPSKSEVLERIRESLQPLGSESHGG